MSATTGCHSLDHPNQAQQSENSITGPPVKPITEDLKGLVLVTKNHKSVQSKHLGALLSPHVAITCAPSLRNDTKISSLGIQAKSQLDAGEQPLEINDARNARLMLNYYDWKVGINPDAPNDMVEQNNSVALVLLESPILLDDEEYFKLYNGAGLVGDTELKTVGWSNGMCNFTIHPHETFNFVGFTPDFPLLFDPQFPSVIFGQGFSLDSVDLGGPVTLAGGDPRIIVALNALRYFTTQTSPQYYNFFAKITPEVTMWAKKIDDCMKNKTGKAGACQCYVGSLTQTQQSAVLNPAMIAYCNQ